MRVGRNRRDIYACWVGLMVLNRVSGRDFLKNVEKVAYRPDGGVIQVRK